MKYLCVLLASFLASFSPALARISTFIVGSHEKLSYSISIPNTTASLGSGPIFLQLKAPSTLRWFALGQGSGMSSANMLVVYSSASANNVTVSPRLGTGHVEPKYNPDAHVSLLEGSGINNGTMTANLRCDTCIEWNGGSLDPMSSSSGWIWAYKRGSPLDSNNVAEAITFHDGFGDFSADLTKARGSNASNPFLAPRPINSVDSSNSSSDSSSDSDTSNAVLIAHGLVMSFAFVVFFPVSALLVPLPYPISIPKVHAPLQLFTLALVIAGMGMGIQLGVSGDLMPNAHPIIGIIVVGTLILFQPVMGLLQHLHYRRTGEKAVFSHLHRWLGRFLIALGIVNGGLGFGLAGVGNPGTPRGAMISYSVLAGVSTLIYLGVHIFAAWISRKRKAQESEAHNDR